MQHTVDPQAHAEYPELALDLQLCFPFYAVSRALTVRYGQLLADVGLTYPQYLVMLALWETSPATVGELGERLRLDSGTLSPLLKRLEQAGLVVRRRDSDDERRVLVEPTPVGWEIRERVTLVPRQVAEAMGLDEESYQELKGRLTEILGHLDAPSQPPSAAGDRGS